MNPLILLIGLCCGLQGQPRTEYRGPTPDGYLAFAFWHVPSFEPFMVKQAFTPGGLFGLVLTPAKGPKKWSVQVWFEAGRLRTSSPGKGPAKLPVTEFQIAARDLREHGFLRIPCVISYRSDSKGTTFRFAKWPVAFRESMLVTVDHRGRLVSIRDDSAH